MLRSCSVLQQRFATSARIVQYHRRAFSQRTPPTPPPPSFHASAPYQPPRTFDPTSFQHPDQYAGRQIPTPPQPPAFQQAPIFQQPPPFVHVPPQSGAYSSVPPPPGSIPPPLPISPQVAPRRSRWRWLFYISGAFFLLIGYGSYKLFNFAMVFKEFIELPQIARIEQAKTQSTYEPGDEFDNDLTQLAEKDGESGSPLFTYPGIDDGPAVDFVTRHSNLIKKFTANEQAIFFQLIPALQGGANEEWLQAIAIVYSVIALNDATFMHRLASLERGKGNHDKAERYAKIARNDLMKIDVLLPLLPPASEMPAAFYLLAGKFPQADEALQRLEKLKWKVPAVEGESSEVNAKRAEFKRALITMPMRAQYWQRQRKYKEAIEAWELFCKTAEHPPTAKDAFVVPGAMSEALVQYTHCLLKVGDRAKAQQHIQYARRESEKVPRENKRSEKLQADIDWLERKLKAQQ
jgi:hypothetical protein